MSTERAEQSRQLAGEQLIIPGIHDFASKHQIDALVRLFDGGKYFEDNPATFTAEPSKADLREGKTTSWYAERAIIASAAILLRESEPPTHEEYIRELMLGHFARASITEPLVEEWTRHLGLYVYTARETRKKADEILVPLSEGLTEDPGRGFRLLQLLTAPHKQISVNDLDSQNEALALLSCYDHFEYQRTDVVATVSEALRQGAFDSLIASEMLEHVAESSSAAIARKGYDGIQKMIRSVRLYGTPIGGALLSESEAIARLSTPGAIALWREDSMMSLTLRKGQYTQDLTYCLEYRRQVLERNGFILPDDPEKSLDTAMEAYKRLLLASGNLSGLAVKATKAQMAAARAHRRHARRGGRKPAQKLAHSYQRPESSFPILDEPRTLLFINGSGQESLPDDSELNGPIGEFLEQSPHNKDLVREVRETVDFLRLIDMSQGRVQGLAVHNKNVTFSGVPVGSVWQFKPDANQYLKITTREGRKMRVLCTLTDQRIGVIAICSRDDMLKVKRGLGLGVSSSTK